MKIILYPCIITLFTTIVFCNSMMDSTINSKQNVENIIDDVTFQKKSLLILPAKKDKYQELSKKVLSIISEEATAVGRFEIIDRGIINRILEEQKFQLSGMVSDNEVIKIGELASAQQAIILDVINFGQKGVPKPKKNNENENNENDETLFSWAVKTVVKESIKNKRKKNNKENRLALENNIHTEFRATVKIVNIETGISNHSFNLNANYTGGNRDASLGKVLTQLSKDIKLKLKEIYMITSEVIEVEGSYINMFSGQNLGLRKGGMFELASKNRIKTYKGKTIELPGNSSGLVKITYVGDEASKAKIVRKWAKIKEGQKAYELNSEPITTDFNITYSQNSRYEIAGKLWINYFSDLSASINYHLGSIKDSRNNMDGYLGLGTDIDYNLFSIFGTSSSVSLTIPALFAWRGDDDGHNVISIFSDPSIDANLSIQISKDRDIVLSASYVFTSMHGPWQWQKDTGNINDDGKNITETEPAVWNDGINPEFKPVGLYFSITLRKIRF